MGEDLKTCSMPCVFERAVGEAVEGVRAVEKVKYSKRSSTEESRAMLCKLRDSSDPIILNERVLPASGTYTSVILEGCRISI